MKGFEKGFGSRLRFVRKKWNLTQAQLADRALIGHHWEGRPVYDDDPRMKADWSDRGPNDRARRCP